MFLPSTSLRHNVQADRHRQGWQAVGRNRGAEFLTARGVASSDCRCPVQRLVIRAAPLFSGRVDDLPFALGLFSTLGWVRLAWSDSGRVAGAPAWGVSSRDLTWFARGDSIGTEGVVNQRQVRFPFLPLRRGRAAPFERRSNCLGRARVLGTDGRRDTAWRVGSGTDAHLKARKRAVGVCLG